MAVPGCGAGCAAALVWGSQRKSEVRLHSEHQQDWVGVQEVQQHHPSFPQALLQPRAVALLLGHGRAGRGSSRAVPGAVPREVPVCAPEPCLWYHFPKAISDSGRFSLLSLNLSRFVSGGARAPIPAVAARLGRVLLLLAPGRFWEQWLYWGHPLAALCTLRKPLAVIS